MIANDAVRNDTENEVDWIEVCSEERIIVFTLPDATDRNGKIVKLTGMLVELNDRCNFSDNVIIPRAWENKMMTITTFC